jgi:hypothetical protein
MLLVVFGSQCQLLKAAFVAFNKAQDQDDAGNDEEPEHNLKAA